MKKKFILFLFTVTFLFCLTSCGGKKETTAQTESEAQTEETKKSETKKETEETLAEGQMYSYLTGEPVDAIPQSGISQAEIVYECLVEYNITRLLCEFQDIEHLNKVGSVRSARH